MKWYEKYYRAVVVCCMCLVCVCTGCRSSRHATGASTVETHTGIWVSERTDSAITELCRTDSGQDSAECMVTDRGRIEIRRDSLGNPCSIEWDHRVDIAGHSSMSSTASAILSFQNESRNSVGSGSVDYICEKTEETKTDVGTSLVSRGILSILLICLACFLVRLWIRR